MCGGSTSHTQCVVKSIFEEIQEDIIFIEILKYMFVQPLYYYIYIQLRVCALAMDCSDLIPSFLAVSS